MQVGDFKWQVHCLSNRAKHYVENKRLCFGYVLHILMLESDHFMQGFKMLTSFREIVAKSLDFSFFG